MIRCWTCAGAPSINDDRYAEFVVYSTASDAEATIARVKDWMAGRPDGSR